MKATRIGPVFGAEVSDVELAAVGSGQIDELQTLLARHEVLVFRDQQMTAPQQLALGRQLGELVVSPFSPNADEAPELIVLDYGQEKRPLTDIWHADETYRPEPPKLTMLRAVIVPELGGDTQFCSMRAAYAGLSDRMQRLIAGLTAVHGFGRFESLASQDPERIQRLHEVELAFPHPNHPVVAVHPETGHKVLYVNRHFTERINELPEGEGRAILELLLSQTARPEFQLSVSWDVGTIVMWDNRSVQHYAGHDYWPQRRRMERVTVAGAAPIGDGESSDVIVDREPVADVRLDTSDDGTGSVFEVATRQLDR